MADVFAIKEIFSGSTASWATFLVVVLIAIRTWNGLPALGETLILWQQTKAAQKVSDWHRRGDEIKRLDDRCIKLEKDAEGWREAEKQCRRDYSELHRQHMEVIERLNALEGYMAGQGRANQEAAGIVALERMGRNKKPPEGK